MQHAYCYHNNRAFTRALSYLSVPANYLKSCQMCFLNFQVIFSVLS